jgi:heme-degrading monooxygenase HmoA
MSATFADLPEPPYYSVIFSSQRTGVDNGYDNMADRMVELAMKQAGFLGVESARNATGFGITVSYWTSLEAIAAWKTHADHRIAQETGIRLWYGHYELRIAKIERTYGKAKQTGAMRI